MPSEQLGSLGIHTPNVTPQTVHITAPTCHNLSLFKDILKEYRKLDDTIVMRLNRANARVRDQDRVHILHKKQTPQDQACELVWRELLANWKRRTQLLDFCVDVMDQSLAEKRVVLHDQAQDPVSKRKTQGDLYKEEVKRGQMHNELTVEDIVRRRSIAIFRSRCQYFTPPNVNPETRNIWDNASK